MMKTFFLLLCAVVLYGAPLCAGVRDEAEPAVQREVERLVKTVQDDDYAAFISQGTPDHRATTKQTFAQASARYRKHLLMGYDMTYLTALRQNGNIDHVWKLSPKDGSDDIVVRLILRDGVVHVFTIR